MEDRRIGYTFIKYVSLSIIGMLGISCYILADTFFIARGVGADGLTALNLALPIYCFIHGTGLMIGMGGGARFAISKPKTVFTHSVAFGALAACLFLLLGVFFLDDLSLLLGANADTLTYTKDYLGVLLYFSPLFLLNNICLCFVRNDGRPKLAMLSMLIGSLLNIALDYVFVFPCNMGMFGAALATGIAPLVSLLIMSSHFLRRHNTFKLVRCKLRLRELFDIASLGASAFIAEFSGGIVMLVFNMVILSQGGNTGVAAYGIIANLALVAISIFTGISQGVQPIISHFYGAGNSGGINKIMKLGYITATSLALFIFIISAVFAEPIVAVFNKDGNLNLAAIATGGLRIYFTAFVFVGINILRTTYYSATDKPKKAFVISILRGLIIIIPAAFVLSALLGITGVWMTMTFTELLVFIVFLIPWRQRHINYVQ